MKYLKFVIIMTILGILLMPTVAFAGTYDVYEQWGPRAKDFLMKFHPNDAAEFTSLELGDIDIVEWPLTKTFYTKWQSPPWNESISIVGAGPEWGMYIMDINNNYSMPDGTHNPANDSSFRLALWYLIDRNFIAANIFEGMASPLWSPVAAAAPDAWKNPACVNAYPYSQASAIAELEANGYTINTETGKRIDPVTGLDVNLQIVYRVDHPYRRDTGIWFCTQLAAVNIGYTAWPLNSPGCQAKVMTNKDFTTYTGGWGLGVDVPDTLYGLFHPIAYSGAGYWSPNYGHYTDAIANAIIENAEFSATLADAIPYVLDWQERYIDPEWVPAPTLVSNMIYHAYRKYYGHWAGEEQYWDLPWKGIVNRPGVGIGAYNSFWTFMSMYPEDVALNNKAPGSYNIRWGWKVSSASTLNPIYGSWVWDWAVMNWIYDTLIGLNPFLTTEDKPWMSYQWNAFLWTLDGKPCTALTFKLRDDVYWQDGTPMTMEDFRWMIGRGADDLYPLLTARASGDPWWYTSIAQIDHFDVIDDQTITIYFNVQSYLALHWIGGLPLIPKHIWYPIVKDPLQDPAAHLADPHLIGNGPYKYVYPSYTPNVGCALTRFDQYFRASPIDVRKTTWSYGGKNYVRVTLYNYALEPISVTVNGTVYNVPAAITGGQYPGTYDFVLQATALPTTLSVSYTYHAKAYNNVYDYSANTIREDTDCNGFVNYIDGIVLGSAFTSKPGDFNWDVRADMKTDGHVNYLDGIMLGAYFSWPNMAPIA
jgi:peptide/nickel transport system substrate-binding protein